MEQLNQSTSARQEQIKKPVDLEHLAALKAAQERVKPLYERLNERARKPSVLGLVIDECVRRARPNETTVELPDKKD